LEKKPWDRVKQGVFKKDRGKKVFQSAVDEGGGKDKLNSSPGGKELPSSTGSAQQKPPKYKERKKRQGEVLPAHRYKGEKRDNKTRKKIALY